MASTSPPAGVKPEDSGGARIRRTWVLILVAVVVAAAAFGASYYFLTLAAPLNKPPVAVIQTSKAQPVTYDTVTYNASASADPDGDALTYLWSLPNGTAVNRVSFSYTFGSTIGTYPFRLTVTDTHGAQDTATLNVTVHPSPLSVGTNVPYPPFEFFNGTTLAGFDIDLADAMAAYAGYAPTWAVYPDFSVLLQTVSAGGVDMAASAITSSGAVGASRNNTMYFSAPYYVVSFGALVKTGSNLSCPGFICTPTQLANRTIGVQTGTTEESWVDDNLVATNMTPSAMVMTYASITSAIGALQAGSVEVVLLESYTAQSVAASSGGSLLDAGLINTGETYSFAFPHTTNGLVLRARMDVALQALMQSGTYFTLYAKWFAA